MFSFLSDLLRWFGQGLLTRPSSATAGVPDPDRWRVTWRPPVGRAAGSETLPEPASPRSGLVQARETRSSSSQKRPERGREVLAARCAGYPWPEQMNRKMSGNVWKTRSSNRQDAPSEARKCWQRVELGIHGLNR